jgi:hypothetical protein
MGDSRDRQRPGQQDGARFHRRLAGANQERSLAGILAAAGLNEARSHKVEDEDQRKGRASKRAVSEISFHSLRHTNVSPLKNAGVSDAKRSAVNKLPVISQQAAAAA